MSTKCSKGQECYDAMNLPEEMEEALRERGGLAHLRSLIPDKECLLQEAKLFQSLSEPIRLQIIHSLSLCDLCPCILKELTGMSDSKLSYHLNILEKAGLITYAPHKKWRIYRLTERGSSLFQAWRLDMAPQLG